MPNSRKRGRRASSAASATSSSPDITATGSTASSPPPNTSLTGTEPTDKKSRFEKRFKTATTSNEDVLRKLYVFNRDYELTPAPRKTIEVMDLSRLPPLPTTIYYARGWRSDLRVCMQKVRDKLPVRRLCRD